MSAMTGQLEVISGPMFSGKSAHLLASMSKTMPCLCLVPSFDTRSGATIRSRTGAETPARSITIWPEDAGAYRCILIDEAHFFVAPHYDGNFIKDVKSALKQGADVTIAGLDFDYLRNPFESVHQLMRCADKHVVLKARCHVCAAPAPWTMKRYQTSHLLEAGDKELYRACCTEHWSSPDKGESSAAADV